MKRYDLIVIGAGPAGLSAATEAAKHGLHPLVLDENEKPGSYLSRFISSLAQRSTKQKSADLK
mgnify:CR=1 FL=1